MKIKVLIIEDEDGIAELLKDSISSQLSGLSHECKFERCSRITGSVETLRDFRPHVVTLDLKDDLNDDATAGRPTWESIRDEHFCPVVFFSANPLPEGFPEHDPFAQYVSKNHKKPEDVANVVGDFVPHIEGLQKLRDEVESRYAKSLQKVSRLVWLAATPQERVQAMLRVTRRRLAATLEHPLGNEQTIKAWEQFIYPPIDDSLCTGDVLRRVGGGQNVPIDYRIILSPPCDLAAGPGRLPVSHVLVGRCISVRSPEVLRKTKRQTTANGKTDGPPNSDLPGQLGRSLGSDKLDSMVVIPKLAGVWPAMVLDLKSLEVVERTKIAVLQDTPAADSEFVRIASMDSPFREALSWRFTHTVGRPGYPDHDETSLAQDVVEAAKLQP